MSYVKQGPRVALVWSDGATVDTFTGHVNYVGGGEVEIRTDDGEFHSLPRAEIIGRESV